MKLAENIKKIRNELGFLQKQVAVHIGVDKSAYSKIEKGTREVTVKELHKMSKLFNMTVDQIITLEGKMPEEVTIEDKTVFEKVNLINQLEKEDKTLIFRFIDKMLTNKKFKDFFNKNIATL